MLIQFGKNVVKLKSKGIGYRKYINELGWREFSHSLNKLFSRIFKRKLRKEFDNFLGLKMKNF